MSFQFDSNAKKEFYKKSKISDKFYFTNFDFSIELRFILFLKNVRILILIDIDFPKRMFILQHNINRKHSINRNGLFPFSPGLYEKFT